MGWTQPVCDACFRDLFPRSRNPHRLEVAERVAEHCCRCNRIVRNGLYIRINPNTVTYATPEENR